MCLEIRMETYLKRCNSRNIRWKVVEEDRAPVYYPYDKICYRKNRIVASDRETKELTADEIESLEVRQGIHVFVRRKDAQEFCDVFLGQKIIKVRVWSRDFVAADHVSEEEVYTKVKVLS